jgi:hypothetical protein
MNNENILTPQEKFPIIEDRIIDCGFHFRRIAKSQDGKASRHCYDDGETFGIEYDVENDFMIIYTNGTILIDLTGEDLNELSVYSAIKTLCKKEKK